MTSRYLARHIGAGWVVAEIGPAAVFLRCCLVEHFEEATDGLLEFNQIGIKPRLPELMAKQLHVKASVGPGINDLAKYSDS